MLHFVSARSLVAGIVFALAAGFGTIGSTATVTCTYGATGAGVSASTDCTQAKLGKKGGNTTREMMNHQDIFTTKTWMFADKIDLPSMVGNYLKITFASDRRTGTWSLLDGLSFAAGEFYAIALKGATKSFVYLLDTSATSGTWNMADLANKGRRQPGLSNITLFGTATPAPIPLPATGLLLIAAVVGLGMMRRRKSLA